MTGSWISGSSRLIAHLPLLIRPITRIRKQEANVRARALCNGESIENDTVTAMSRATCRDNIRQLGNLAKNGLNGPGIRVSDACELDESTLQRIARNGCISVVENYG